MLTEFVSPVRWRRCFGIVAFMLLAGVPVAPSLAQNFDALQLDRARALTSEQRQQILRALGQSGTPAPVQQTESDPDDESPEMDEPDRFEPPMDVLGPQSSIVVELVRVEDDKESELLTDVENALGMRAYQLDDKGFLDFPGVGPVLLAGLTAEQATLRLQAEENLHDLLIAVYLLPVELTGTGALEPFGADLFNNSEGSFTPADIPVPLDYVIGPGDVINVVFYGQQNDEYTLNVGRDGRISLPGIGPMLVNGLSFENAREDIQARVQEAYVGVSASVTLSELRSIRVFVLGDVLRPGSYSVSSLSTMTNALFQSGGIARSGSYRRIELKRQNRVVQRLDLYDLLLKGNTKGDRRLRAGDVVYVPPVGDQVSVAGEVVRPAIYEIDGDTTVNSVLALAGGLRAGAYAQDIQIERFNAEGSRSVITLDYPRTGGARVQGGDKLTVQGALSSLEDAVFLRGHLRREGVRQWRSGMRLLDVFPDATAFKVQADQNYILVRRVDPGSGLVSLLSANWRHAYRERGSSENIELARNDTLYVFSLSSDRARRIEPLIQELQTQASSSVPAKTVKVQGRIRSPGLYPFEPGMRISDLLRAAGSTLDNAYLENSEVTRLEREGSNRRSVHRAANLLDLVPGGPEDLLLQPDDVLTIKEVPLYRELMQVELEGEIQFPGEYSASRGERLSDLVLRAGGLTDMAFVDGSVFLRRDLRDRERRQMRQLARRIRAEASALDDSYGDARERAEALVEDLESTDPLGRLVIDLRLALTGDPEHDVVLEDGDQLIVPAVSQEVTVIGEVQYPTSHIHERSLSQQAYLMKSGGLTRNADRQRIYVIRADGEVVSFPENKWFKRAGTSIDILPGDTIVVPFDADRIGSLTLWSTASQILYNIGVAAAAIASF